MHIDIGSLRYPYALVFDPTEERLAIGGLGAVLVADLRDRAADRTFQLGVDVPGDAGAACHLAFAPDGRSLVVSTRRRALTGPASGVFRIDLREGCISRLLSANGEAQFGALGGCRRSRPVLTGPPVFDSQGRRIACFMEACVVIADAVTNTSTEETW